MSIDESTSGTREAAIRRARRKKLMRRTVVGLGAAAALGALFWWALRGGVSLGPDRSVQYPDQGRTHIAEGASHPAYNSNPPTSGWHYEVPARLGFYDEELPDERLIHNLEHGEIWISYTPSLPDAVKEELKTFLGPRVVITKREKNETDIAIVAWTRLDGFDIENGALTEDQKSRIRDFISRWQNRGPEKVFSQPF